MQLFFDFLPVLAFFVAYKLGGIYVATGTIIVAVLIQAAVQWHKHRKLSPMMLTSTVLVLIFGGITLLVRDKTFIQWKPTVLDWLFATAFLASQFVGDQPLVQKLMGSQVTLEPARWRALNLMWVAFFALMGAANIYVLYHFDESTWVNFKVFGMLGLTLVFVVLQGIWLASKLPKDGTDDDDTKIKPANHR
jgi:intracellular septation protein